MANLGICKLCDKEQARYKCATCALPFCSLSCYKPHKEQHANEPSTKPAETQDNVNQKQQAESQTTTNTATTSSEPITLPTPAVKSYDFSSLLENKHLIHALQHNTKLCKNLSLIYKAGLKSTFDDQNARILLQQDSLSSTSSSSHNAFSYRGRGGRGRGGRGQRGAFGRDMARRNLRPVEWTAERGAERSLKKLKGLRKGGREEDGEIEEFSDAVLGILGVYDDDDDREGHGTV